MVLYSFAAVLVSLDRYVHLSGLRTLILTLNPNQTQTVAHSVYSSGDFGWIHLVGFTRLEDDEHFRGHLVLSRGGLQASLRLPRRREWSTQENRLRSRCHRLTGDLNPICGPNANSAPSPVHDLQPYPRAQP